MRAMYIYILSTGNISCKCWVNTDQHCGRARVQIKSTHAQDDEICIKGYLWSPTQRFLLVSIGFLNSNQDRLYDCVFPASTDCWASCCRSQTNYSRASPVPTSSGTHLPSLTTSSPRATRWSASLASPLDRSMSHLNSNPRVSHK